MLWPTMKDLATASAGELLELVGTAVGTLLFTAIGTITEHAALQNLSTGQTTLGAWEAAVGMLAIVAGLYFLGYQEFRPRLKQVLQSR